MQQIPKNICFDTSMTLDSPYKKANVRRSLNVKKPKEAMRIAVEKYSHNRMLGHREIVNGQPGKYVWKTYKEVYDLVLKVGSSIRSCGIDEACNAHGLHCVPLYDTLGADAVEFIICHAEVTVAFVEEKKISEGENKHFDLPVKRKGDICTIMYTSGTTGDPKGVMISNNSIVTLIAGVKRLLGSVNESLTSKDVYISYLPLAHIFDRVIEVMFY